MILTAHIIFASTVSSAARFSLPAAFLFGFVSHHLLDFIPHIDAGSFWPRADREKGKISFFVLVSILIDVLVSLGFLIWLWFGLKISLPLLFWASAGAVLPDFIDSVLPFLIPQLRNRPFFKRYEKFHSTFFQYAAIQENWILGILSTVLIIGVSGWLLLK